jgi:hypothetical protein
MSNPIVVNFGARGIGGSRTFSHYQTLEGPKDTAWWSDGDISVRLFLHEYEGIDACVVDVLFENGFAGVGPIYMRNLQVSFFEMQGSNRVPYEIGGALPVECEPGGGNTFALTKDTLVLPRGVLAYRFFLGPEAERLAAGEQYADVTNRPKDEYIPNCQWFAQKAVDGLNSNKAGALVLGDSYALNDPAVNGDGSLNGSHGAWKLNPYFFGGFGSWQSCTIQGYAWAQWEMFATMHRSPILALTGDGQHMNLEVPYWLGRTAVHELPGYKRGEDWNFNGTVEFDEDLYDRRAHDYTHLHRQDSAAAMLYLADDPVAQYWMDATCNDADNWLFGAVSQNNLLCRLPEYLELHAPAPGNGDHHMGGRGGAHTWRAYIWNDRITQPLVDAVAHFMISGTGCTHRAYGSDPHYPEVDPYTRAREVDLWGPNLEPLGFVRDHEHFIRYMLAQSPVTQAGQLFSVAESIQPFEKNQNWTQRSFGNPDYYPNYDLLREDLRKYADDPGAVLSAGENGSPNENVVDLLPPHLWMA